MKNNKNKGIEKIWITKQIKNSIKLRRRFNREHRRAVGEEKNRYKTLYIVQKKKVQEEVWNAKSRHEERVTQEIKANKDGKKMWKMIDKLKNDSPSEGRRTALYDYGKEVVKNQEGDIMMTYWSGIYKKGENKIEEVWNRSDKKLI